MAGLRGEHGDGSSQKAAVNRNSDDAYTNLVSYRGGSDRLDNEVSRG
ncbi:MAG: hypothetical protein IH818_12765 [Acidobacteria bacterium]|nr:hypothetical protein [Acidobacteriota bacterium]